MRLHIVNLGAADHPDLRECRQDVIRPVLSLTPDGQAAVRFGLPTRDAKSRDYRVPQKIDVRRVVTVALRHERVSMREQRLVGLPSGDRVAVLHDERIDLVDSSGADGACCPPASGCYIRTGR